MSMQSLVNLRKREVCESAVCASAQPHDTAWPGCPGNPEQAVTAATIPGDWGSNNTSFVSGSSCLFTINPLKEMIKEIPGQG